MARLKNTINSNSYAVILAFASGAAHAQVAPDAGSVLRDQQRPALEVPVRPVPAIKLDEPVRPALKPSDARFMLKALRISGNSAFTQDELLVVVRGYVGKEAGFVDLEAAAGRISDRKSVV